MLRRIPGLLLGVIRRVRFLTLLVCFGLCSQHLSATEISQPPLSENPPLWTASPKQIGYDVVLFHAFGSPQANRPHPLIGGDEVKIQFLDADRLALAWLTFDEIVKKPVTVAADVPSHLHLSILDAKSGRRISYHEWACSSRRTNLAYTANGQWLLSSNESVTLYSSSFEQVRDLLHVRAQLYGSLVSTSGRSFIVSVADSQGAWSSQLRDSATFEVIDSWEDSRFANTAFVYSDRFILAQIQKPSRLFIREIGKRWNPFSAEGDGTRPVTLGSCEFLNDDTLVRSTGHELTVAKVSGSELFKQAFPDTGLFIYSWPVSATSTEGERFAFVLDRMRGLRSGPLDMYPFAANDRVIVYSVAQRSAIFGVKVRGSSPWYPGFVWNRIAISPDGLLLGIVSSDGVRVYALPPDQPGP